MTSVLVTGATTPIGAALVARLGQRTDVEHVVAVSDPRRPMPESRAGVSIVPADLTRERDLRELMFGIVRRERVGVVIHAAHHRAARDAGAKIHELNVESTRQLVRLAEAHPTVRRFVLRSYADVYEIRPDRPTILLEDHPLEMSRLAPQWVRDRVEADLVAGVRMGMTDLTITIMRCAECLAPRCGSQLYDYLQSKVCFTPMGFNPMLNVISIEDLVDATVRAAFGSVEGIVNVPGFDSLPLKTVIRKAGRTAVAMPSPLLHGLYGLRAIARGTDFRYDQNYFRFHFGGVLDGTRARQMLGYVPKHPLDFSTLTIDDVPARKTGSRTWRSRPRSSS